MLDGKAVFAVLSALIVILFTAAVWRGIRRLQQTVQRLQQAIATLERERVARPSPRVAFEFNATTREALRHVTNDGGDGEMRAPMSIEGVLANQLKSQVSAVWSDSGGTTVIVRRGETRTLRLAKLDLSVFPYAQWEIYAVASPDHLSLRAMHTSMIGGDPETHAPTLFLQVALVTSPTAVSPPPQCTVALQPFAAVRLRPL